MNQGEKKTTRAAETAIYKITQFSPSLAKKTPGLRDVEGVETWVDLHLRPVQAGKLDLTKEASVRTQAGNTYTVCIEGSHFANPTSEARQSGIWQAGDWLITVSGVSIEQLQRGDVLVQEANAKERPARRK